MGVATVQIERGALLTLAKSGTLDQNGCGGLCGLSLSSGTLSVNMGAEHRKRKILATARAASRWRPAVEAARKNQVAVERFASSSHGDCTELKTREQGKQKWEGLLTGEPGVNTESLFKWGELPFAHAIEDWGWFPTTFGGGIRVVARCIKLHPFHKNQEGWVEECVVGSGHSGGGSQWPPHTCVLTFGLNNSH